MRSAAPAEPGQDDNERDGVQDGCHEREDDLHLEEGEGELHLDEVSDLEQVEEGPEDGDDEAGDHHEEEPVIVTNAEWCVSYFDSVDCWSSTGHADHTQHLTIFFMFHFSML